MEKFVIEPVFPHFLSEIAGFLFKCRTPEMATSSARRTLMPDTPGIERRIRWLLLDNPAAKHSESLGFCARDESGTVRGLTLCFPASFLRAGERIAGLGSGSFFVDSAMRSLGFFLFKRYLACPGYAFYFATTCNVASAPLWRQLGGAAVARSEFELVLPLRLDSLAANRIARIMPGRFFAEAARMGGRCAVPLLRLSVRSDRHLKVEPCQDWNKLAALAWRHCLPDRVTSDRSAEMLYWRYGSDSPVQAGGIHLFRDSLGNEGWFALSGNTARTPGRAVGCTLLDVIWPSGKIDFRDILPQIIRSAPDSAEAVFIRCRPDFDFTKAWRWFVRQRLASPRAYVIAGKGAPSIRADLFDYEDNDYVAWS
jgi:hypothetical protein